MIKIADISSKPPKDAKKGDYKKKFEKLTERIAELQYKLYAQEKYSLLVVFQGMDSSGKDGTTRKVFAEVPPYGINVKGYGKPTDVEFAHDFLWRVHKETPAKGMIKVFNRSHYEDILIQRVHKWIDEKRVDARIKAINAFEELLEADNNTIVLKFFLHLSFERQGEKLQERIDTPYKNWKHNDGDWKERKHWDEYMRCYNEVFNRCNSIPWNIIPADEQWYRNFLVAEKVVEALEALPLECPLLNKEELTVGLDK